jgi:acetolactate synthase-1/2/3 large subunit
LKSYTGSDLVADFIAKNLSSKVFLVTGGACAFIVDAIGRHKKIDYVCFQHEQAAAMAADAVWRTTGKLGVTVATSGPGATNLITGIACSWFDSIPSFHITGQVNENESRETLRANVRQAGFQETDIVSIVKPITKWAKKIKSIEELAHSLPESFEVAIKGRRGPVLIDIPMNIQKAEVSQKLKKIALRDISTVKSTPRYSKTLSRFFDKSLRPLVLIGAGAGLAGSAKFIQNWCEKNSIPYVTSWGAVSYIDRSKVFYQGSIGVYGSRHANWTVQSADKILVLGSRLDNRQRTGNPKSFAPFAEILVIDVDSEELKKYRNQNNILTVCQDLSDISNVLEIEFKNKFVEWNNVLISNRKEMVSGFSASSNLRSLNPYDAVIKIQEKFKKNSLVVSDCGANLCWVYQAFAPDASFLFTAGGNSPMGYSLPAAIGAKLVNPKSEVYCFIGDGGMQMNIQELQTVKQYNLNIKIFIQNNFGYGIIKQFQDAYFQGRYFASGEGYSQPDFKKIASAYGIEYRLIKSLSDIDKIKFTGNVQIFDLILSPDSLITPKTEMDRFIHDQFPYVADESISKLPYEYPTRPSQI